MKYLLVATLLVFSSAQAVGGGLNRLGGVGPRAGAMSGAYIALSDDASLFYYNPAGLGQTEQPWLEIGGELLRPRFSIEGRSRPLESDRNAQHYLPLIGLGWPIDQKLKIGLGVYVPYGLGAKFDHNRSQLGYDTETMISLTTLSPTVAWAVNERLWLGVGLDIGYGQFLYRAPFDLRGRPLPLYTDTQADGFGLGGSFGLLWKPSDHLSLGLRASLPVKVKLSGRSRIGRRPFQISDRVETEFTFPARIGVGSAWQATDRLTLALDLNYYLYQPAVRSMTLEFDRLPIRKTNRLDWENIFGLHFGGQLKASENLTIRAGLGYQGEAVPDQTVSSLTPDVAGWSVSGGLEYRRDHFSLAFSGIYAWGERDINHHRNQAERLRVNVFSANLTGTLRF